MPGMKVVAISQHVENGAFTSVDNLELSTMWSAAFAPGFLGIILAF